VRNFTPTDIVTVLTTPSTDDLSSSIRRWLDKRGAVDSVTLKHQRKYLKLERSLEQCGDDIQSLSRFSNAQVVAFRKILKKYKVCDNEASIAAPQTRSR
jgi:SPX domain protein involved in polyphosphate accumulation